MNDKQYIVFPGSLYFGSDGRLLKTLLGSCVAITLWHPVRALGGMCHYKLPTRVQSQKAELDACYGDESMQILLNEIKKYRSNPVEYRVGVYGGANMFPALALNATGEIGINNIEMAIAQLDRHGFHITEKHVGGSDSLRLSLDLSNGFVSFEEILRPKP